jgi:DNA-binding transcriptional MerR regulator
MISSMRDASSTKKYYAIREVAQLLNVSTSLLRFWEKKFPSLQPQKDQKGSRRYTQADIAQLETIYQLVKKQGYTLQGAQEAIKQIKHEHGKPRNNVEAIHTLKRLREFLVLLKENVASTE